MKKSFFSRAAAYVAGRIRAAVLNSEVAAACGMVVQSGSFTGMKLLDKTSWGNGDLAPKILGCYEQELQASLEKAITRSPDVVVNVGCAEGYFAVGLARRLPKARVLAFDISEKARAVCAKAARQNNVAANFEVHGRCDGAQLAKLAIGAKRMLIVMDCEGAEIDLLDSSTVEKLTNCDLIIECHDFFNRQITPELTKRLSVGHQLEIIKEGTRNTAAYECLKNYSSLDRALAVCEFRKELTSWIVAWGR